MEATVHGNLTRFQQRTRRIRNLKRGRHLTQLAIAILVVVAAVRHQVEKDSGAASVDALCPFGAMETLITWVTTGSLITKTHPSNLVLGLAVLVATLLVGNAFCGWICPFGAVQDALTWVRRKLRLPAITVPRGLDRALRWGRFVVLAVILYFSYVTASLWFADYDPYVALFGLHWLFEPDTPALWIGLSILAVVVVGSVLVERAWCRYLCPLGGVLSVLSRFSLLRIRRAPTTCTDCSLCDKACPVGIEPSKAAPMVSPDCIGCMDCVTTCPVRGALGVDAPVLLGTPIRIGASSEVESR
ncbi:MAG: hypothetical protein CVT65_12900 [Actinobacteria bacterium HGW-Actinobacteria-5]|nr:MAG: hypothetical protein CVT65_12900 [Actinobacteria bacterium HGW-Actinobacteria-5]